MASSPIPLPRLKESPYTKVCSLRRQSSSPASSISYNTSDSPTSSLHSVLKKSRESHSMYTPSWNRGNNDVDDVFVASLEHVNASSTEPSTHLGDVIPNQCNQSSLSKRDTALLNVNGVSKQSGVEHFLSNALSTLMIENLSGDEVCVASHETSSCPLEDTSLQDFEVIGEEATENGSITSSVAESTAHPGYVRTGVRPSLPSPDVLGCGNPFLIFLCLTVLLQHRDSIINRGLDSNEMAMHFDRLVRKHDVERVLSQARTLYYRYLGHFNSQNS